jgi:hypothetical protein
MHRRRVRRPRWGRILALIALGVVIGLLVLAVLIWSQVGQPHLEGVPRP